MKTLFGKDGRFEEAFYFTFLFCEGFFLFCRGDPWFFLSSLWPVLSFMSWVLSWSIVGIGISICTGNRGSDCVLGLFS